jgi:mRNA interferase YafQ
MQRTIRWSNAFKKDYKRECKAGHKNWPKILIDVLSRLESDRPLPPSLRDHPLSGSWKGYRDLHIKPDLVLIYRKQNDGAPTLMLARLGSHSELFK